MFKFGKELAALMETFVAENEVAGYGEKVHTFGCMDCSNSCAENCARKCKKNSR